MPGPPPKPADKRARRNKDPHVVTTIAHLVAPQPGLPEDGFICDGVPTVWPRRTREWWAMWGESAQATQFTAADWDFLLDTATIHARFWRGDAKMAGELRLRCAKFGQTPEDRARLRIQFVGADLAEQRHDERSAHSGYDHLTATLAL